MGNVISKKRLRQTTLNWGSAIWRRLQLWRELKPVVLHWMSISRSGNREAVEASRTPELGFEDPTTADEDEAVNATQIVMQQALPVGRTQVINDEQQPGESFNQSQVKLPVRDHGEEHMPINEHELESREDSQSEDIPQIDLELVRDIQSTAERMAPNLGKTNEPEPDETAPMEVQEEYVSEYIRSSLNVALPTFEGLSSSAKAEFPILWFDNKRPVIAAVSKDANVVETPSTPAHPSRTLPPSIEGDMKTMLTNYETWDKKVYSSVHLDQTLIRLVEILPGSSDELHVKLFKKPLGEIENAYEALSYVWGPPTPARMIQVNGVSVQVNPNLFDAILALRLPDDRRAIWIDAICINQTDTRERSIEVRKMGDIYRLAKTVVIFLGAPSSTPSPSSIGHLFKFLNRFDSDPTLEKPDDGRTVDLEPHFQSCRVDRYDVCKGFVELCLRPWWGRIWVMQEFYLASAEPIWYWGDKQAGNGALKRDMELLMSISRDLYWHGSSSYRSDVQNILGKPMPLFSNDVRRIFDLISRRAAMNGFDIPSRLYRELSARSTDPRDIVYGLREIFDPVFRKVFVPDYFMSQELLFACLAVFLIQFEGWGDVLWYYPFRYAGEENKLPSWLPDFTQRVVPAELDIVPRDHLVSRKSQPKLVILNHALHAEGYKLDTIIKHMHLGCNGFQALQWFWQFDQAINHNQACLGYVVTDEERQKPWFDLFIQLCRETAAGQSDKGIVYPKASVFEWTSRLELLGNVTPHIADSLPCWRILERNAFKVGEQGISEQGDDNDPEQGLLEEIFSPRMESVFRNTLALDFLGACVYDWTSLAIVLDKLVSASPWSEADSAHWKTLPELSNNDQMERARIIVKDVGSFLTVKGKEAGNSAWIGLDHYSSLCKAIILDCDDHDAFMRIVKALKSAGTELNAIAFDYRTRAEVSELQYVDPVVAAQVRRYNEIADQYSGRCLFWTKQGFHGLTSPGVQFCDTAIVALLDGLSFPMVVRNADETGRGQLVGCTIVRGVDMQGKDSGKAKLPAGFSLEEDKKTVFKFI